MNKRARLARRILRDHQRGINYHAARYHFAWWNFWACPHCPRRTKMIPMEVPRAYR